jgi:hypothetical protein
MRYYLVAFYLAMGRIIVVTTMVLPSVYIQVLIGILEGHIASLLINLGLG